MGHEGEKYDWVVFRGNFVKFISWNSVQVWSTLDMDDRTYGYALGEFRELQKRYFSQNTSLTCVSARIKIKNDDDCIWLQNDIIQ